MGKYVLRFQEIDRTMISTVGGKSVNLAELSRINEINVPEGFCVTTKAYKDIIENDHGLNKLIDKLKSLNADERERVGEIAAAIRTLIERKLIPKSIEGEIFENLARFQEHDAFAVRSSATAEDLPTASFAGQQDTYLNIIGRKEILKHISKCWASLFTDRSIIYRMQNGFDHRQVSLSVIIQRMVFPDAAGVMFTADPVNGDRKVLSIDAGFGFGEALVSGLINPDIYKVRERLIVDKKIPTKKFSIIGSKGGGIAQHEITPEKQNEQVLADEQILRLENIGRRIESHFAYPQDIEWCLVNDEFYIVQSRPITTLFPIPKVSDDKFHVYVSVGHQQMMTDAMKPLGVSVWQLSAARPMFEAGGRMFVDVASELASPQMRETLINSLGKSDPLIRDALTSIVEREDFRKLSDDKKQISDKEKRTAPLPDFQTLKDYDASIVADLIKRKEDSIEELKNEIQTKSRTDLIDFIRGDFETTRKRTIAEPESFAVIMTGMNASWWINEKMNEWLGEKNAADTISQSVSNNITSEMGLALLDVADVIRPYPEIIAFLQSVGDDNFLDQLHKFNDGDKVRAAIESYLDRYGMRCAGEIDITRTRWREKPSIIIPMLLTNIRNFEPGAGKRKFEQGREEASKKERDLLERLKQLPEGEQKATETKRIIDLVRNLIGYREYPKYSMVSRYFVYKMALLREAEQLVLDKVIQDKEDIYYLKFDELREVLRTKKADQNMISARKEEFKLFEKLHPPRVITSDGEIITSSYSRNNIPAEAIVGLAVSSGVVEGRARVIVRVEDANLEDGDILVTIFTDPSWTPLFVSIKALVTEVGGLMTHGAVIAREYGLPAVIGVENATTLIKDGQRIRVNGTEGYVEIL